MSGDVEVVSGVTAFALVTAPAVALLLIAAGFGVLIRSLRRQAELERASLRVDAFSLRAGRVALAGTVELLDGEADPAPVKVGVDGKIEARAFLLKLESGLRLRVEPGERPLLRDALEGQVASLTAGERVFVRGVLKTPITAGPHAARPVLAPPRRGRLLLSTEAFSGELDRRASRLGFQPLMLLLAALATQLFYAGYYVEAVLHWLGREAPATIVVAFSFWVVLVVGSVILGSILSAWDERPWHAR